jgi:uncharacterized protein (DUF58 family)
LTARAGAFIASGLSLIAVGWFTGWPELTALGAGAMSLVLAAALLTGRVGGGSVQLNAARLTVTRGQPASAKLTLASAARRRSLRLVEGPIRTPRRTLAVPPGRAALTLELKLDTDRRGEHTFGPVTLVRGDPWSLFCRVVAQSEAGRVVVRPRISPVRSEMLRSLHTRNGELRTKHRGDDDFFALREYVWGDEPRDVHWRSSARTGQLVVKQRIAAASQTTLIALDCEATAYASSDAFGEGFLADRFETAVDATASLVVGHRRITTEALLTTTAAAGLLHTRRRSIDAQLDALAVVAAAAPADCLTELLPSIVRRVECSRLVVVTGTPSRRLLAVLSRIRQSGVAGTVVRVQAVDHVALAGLEVADIETTQDLA